MVSKQRVKQVEEHIFGSTQKTEKAKVGKDYNSEEVNREVIRQARDEFRGTEYEEFFEDTVRAYCTPDNHDKYPLFTDYLRAQIEALAKSGTKKRPL